ncbi:Zn-ribbon domain-containing OB-fold protein [Kineobactrum salinum]|uniref:OB-fold domain-containing protein n=1 Tax=Kineobactrum salinum TaxID=2708301 RepID=A0A6C0U217_9GAMM|nr:OB-fold domain-containing protein [Kineobactrum salinum]QIB66066.1 OB-fold domain-containing protein [Kineobactrum salinum]
MHCDFFQFPRQEHCPGCLQSLQERSLGGTGVIYSVTTVRVRPPLGLPQPYAVAYVDLDDVPLRVFGLIDPDQCESVCIGDRVVLKVLPLGLNQQQQSCLRPCFHRLTNQE